MKYPLIFKLIGHVLIILALLMLIPIIFSFIYKSPDARAFLLSSLITGAAGFILTHVKTSDKKFRARDAYAAVTLAWTAISLFGALPYIFAGCFTGVIDCLFESVSGFTTTGATIASVTNLSNAILFWRNLTQLIGGVGVLTFIMAIMPTMNASSLNLLRAEATGPSPEKASPRIKDTAKIIYIIYAIMFTTLFIALCIARLSVFDALMYACSVVCTGGFMHTIASGPGAGAAEVIIFVFMFLSGINFSLYFFLVHRRFKSFLKDEELRVYFIVTAISIALITINTVGRYNDFYNDLRYAAFHAVSFITTTGLYAIDYNTWPAFSRLIIITLMITGACAGSTGGGIKLIRFTLMIKTIKIEIDKLIHPKSIKTVNINGKKVDNETALKAASYFFIYFAALFILIIPLSVESGDLNASFLNGVSILSNIGIGNFTIFSPFTKSMLCLLMIAGRLEFIPLLVLFKTITVGGQT